MAIKYGKIFGTRKTPQSKSILGSGQVPNSAGGFSWEVDHWQRLDRFLILGSESGTYYIGQSRLTIENAQAVIDCLAEDGLRVVSRTVEISKSGRAAKNDPAIYVLAIAAKVGDDETRKAARAALARVCRTGTHLMHFADYLEAFGGWGRGTRKAVASWYNDKPAGSLAYQLVKYQARDGWSNRDLLRLCHAKPVSAAHNALFKWATSGELSAENGNAPAGTELVVAFEKAKSATDYREIVALIDAHNLPREAIPTQWMIYPEVWAALLVNMPVTAMIRNLANMTRCGLLTSMSNGTKTVVERLRDKDRLRKARVHPVAILAALMTYKSGRGTRGRNTWNPVGKIVDALDGAFYKSFANVEPTSKRTLLALDVSSSMTGGTVGGVVGLTPRVASAAMALITAATEEDYQFVAFTGGGWRGNGVTHPSEGLSELSISPRQRLDDVVRRISNLPFGGTDCALPMLWALEKKVAIDTFVIYTDSETWAGTIHPAQALAEYRRKMSIPAKLVVVGMVSNGFSIADPTDSGMLDVVGFDTAAPAIISNFARGS